MKCNQNFAKGMKAALLVCMLFFFCGTVMAQNVTVSAKNATLKSVMSQITQQTGYKFAYSDAVKADNIRVSVDASNEPVQAVFEKIFNQAGISYKVEGKMVSLSAGREDRGGRPRQITGRVTDNNGEPVVGATVLIQGTMNGTSTDADGKYSIAARPSDLLTFTCIGYTTLQAEVGRRAVIDAILLDDVEKLQEIVVTGYQTLSKERSAGSFSTVKGEAIQDKANARGSIIESLEGVAPGLQVNLTGNDTSSEKYTVRGITSVYSNKQPLFVVDGIAIEVESLETLLNSDDIQSVTVLKDATAASIWGSQAANGVVVIETKTGRNTNGKYSVKYSGTYTWKGKPDYAYQDLMDSKTFIKNALEVFDPVGYKESAASTGTTGSANFVRNAILFPHEVPMYDCYAGRITESERDAQLAVLANRSWYDDYSKYMMSDAWLTKHTVSIEGGNNKSQLFTSLTYEGNKGTSKNLTNNFKVNIREVYNVAKWLKLDFGINTALTTSDYHTAIGYGSGRGLTYRNSPSMSSLPYAALFDENGNPLDHSVYDMSASLKAQAEAALGTSLTYYPLDDFNLSMNKSRKLSIRANAGITVKFFDGFRYEGKFSYNRASNQYELYYPGETYVSRYEQGISYDKTTKTQYGPSSGGYFKATDGYATDWTVRNQLVLDKTFNSKHQVAAVAGLEFRENHTESNSSVKVGYDYQTMQATTYDWTRLQKTMTSAMLSPIMGSTGLMLYKAASDSFSQSDVSYRYFSFYGNAGYTYDRRYSVNASVRIDQSNLFGSDPSNQFKPIWSVGAVWNAKNEKFLQNVNWLSKLSLRASYGLGGNAPQPGYGSPVDIIGSSTTAYVDHVVYYISSPAANKIHWEKTTTKNLGIDFAFFQHRLYGSIDLYDKYTTDLLDSKPLDSTTGYTTIKSNVGEISNKGVELTLGGSIFRTRDFQWDAVFNFAYNKNLLVKYYHTAYTSPSNMTGGRIEGYPLGAVFAYKWGGLTHDTGIPQIELNDGSLYSGAYSKLSADEIHYQGTQIAPYFGSLSSSLKYKGIGLSFMFVYNFGNKIWNDELTYWYDRLGENVHNDFDKRWREPGDEATTNIPSYLYTGKGRTYSNEKNLYMYADINVLDGSFVKLRELKLSYDLQQKALKAMKIKGLSVYAQTNNLFYIAANKEGIDPEYAPSVGSYRPMKMGPAWTFGLTVNF